MPQKKHRRQASSQSGFPFGAGFPTSLSTGVGANLGTGLNGLNSSSNLGNSHYRIASGGANLLSLASNSRTGLGPGNINTGLGNAIESSIELDRIAREFLVESDNLKPLNEKVLQRYNPAVFKVLHIVPYAVVYSFSPSSQSWERCVIEGSLFVVELSNPSEDGSCEERGRQDEKGQNSKLSVKRFAVMILNRRNLENFCVELNDPHDVDVTAEYIMLQGVNVLQKDPSLLQGTSGNVPTGNVSSAPASRIYGLWIFSETQSHDNDDSIPSATPSIPQSSKSSSSVLKKTADIVHQCAREAERSRMAMAARAASVAAQTPTLEAFSSNGSIPSTPHDAPPLIRQLSLRDLFGEQRAQDSGWSVSAPPGRDDGLLNRGTPQQFSQPEDVASFSSPAGHAGPPMQAAQGSVPNGLDMNFGLSSSQRAPFPPGPPGSNGQPHGAMPPPGFGPVGMFANMPYANPAAVPGRYPHPMLPPNMQPMVPPGIVMPMGMPQMQGFPPMGPHGLHPGPSAQLPHNFGPVGHQIPNMNQQQQQQQQQHSSVHHGGNPPQAQPDQQPHLSHQSGGIPSGNHLLSLFGRSGSNSPAVMNSSAVPQKPVSGYSPSGNTSRPRQDHPVTSAPHPSLYHSASLSHLTPSAFFQMAGSGFKTPSRASAATPDNMPSSSVGHSLGGGFGAPGASENQSGGLLALFGPGSGVPIKK